MICSGDIPCTCPRCTRPPFKRKEVAVLRRAVTRLVADQWRLENGRSSLFAPVSETKPNSKD
jgi:hypothetical protein